ncbi:MAG: di-heme enzyme [Sandaracinus sp.]|nr:di-heme enzyme [Sandaracinus sp.]MCB9621511.1 di-heme enzyme [Sandaracinus sp.]
MSVTKQVARGRLGAVLCRVLALLALVVACSPEGDSYVWALPEGFPEPRVPEDNPMSDAKVELGRHLFYDVRLSGNQTQSCASCHFQELAFTDALPVSVGSTGESTPRGAMSLVNVAYTPTLTWASPVLRHLEQQALVPMFGESPVELGLAGLEDELLARLRAEPRYAELFPSAFPDEDDPVSLDAVTKALAAFQRSLISADAPWDRYEAGDTSAVSEAARRGGEFFFSEAGECFHCHGGFLFSSSVDHAGNVFDQATFQNNGLYDVDGRGAYPATNTGLYEHTAEPRDMGRFKPPTLRNVALTAPYMHDGSLATLDDVLDHYAAGGTVTTEGPNAGDGRTSPNKSLFVHGFTLDEGLRADLHAFLEALTDEGVRTNPRFSDPWLRPLGE